MNTTTKFNFFAFILLSLFTFSCSSDESSESFGISTGNYLPLAINNSWKYFNASQSLVNEMKIIGTANFRGTTYYEFKDDSQVVYDITQWFGKKGATYFLKVDDTTVNENGLNITIKSYELPILKDDFELNNYWTGSVSPKVTYTGNGNSGSLPFRVSYNGVNYYKGEVTLDDISYPNVIKTRISISINANNQITNSIEEYWFAENLGIIKIITNNNSNVVEKNIYDYSLN